MQKIDIQIGEKYNNWLVLESSYTKSKKTYYNCLCTSCNNSKVSLTKGDLIGGKRLVCYSCYILKIRKYPEHISETRRRIFSGIKAHAKKRKIPFNVEISSVYKLLEDQKYKCPISGLVIDVDGEEKTASLDRKDSSLGYIKSNIWWVHKDVNIMKNKFDIDYFLLLCRKINQKNK